MSNVKKSLEETACRHNVTVSEVESEIQLMIDELYDSDDLKIREAWTDMSERRKADRRTAYRVCCRSDQHKKIHRVP